jgi:HAD superfamily hydrolase (TIGR01484 family)
VPHKFILSVHDPAERDALAARVRAYFEQTLDAVSVVSSHRILVEGLPKGVNKSVGLRWLAAHYGIDRTEVLAVGDNDNDLEMLEWAGVGIAMGNASRAVLAAADWVAPSVTEDGAAIALEKYLRT